MPQIHTIDLEYLGRSGSIASYVIDGPDGPVLIETGPGNCTGTLTRGLAALGLAPEDVRHVLVTHIHFDHAGAAGWMAQRGAVIHVHEFGARHLVDPSRLNASARRIYGERMDEIWGELVPVPADQIVAVHDGDVLRVGGLEVRAVETPGHARHHHAYLIDDDAGPIVFTGDAAGCFVTEAPTFMSLPTPPPEFDLETWQASLDRLERLDAVRLYPTHFGAVDDIAAHLDRVRRALDEHVAFIRAHRDAPRDRIAATYRDWFIAQAEAHAVPAPKMGFYVKDSLAAMNVSGILRYLDQKDAATVTASR